jgi:hypothetical protein
MSLFLSQDFGWNVLALQRPRKWNKKFLLFSFPSTEVVFIASVALTLIFGEGCISWLPILLAHMELFIFCLLGMHFISYPCVALIYSLAHLYMDDMFLHLISKTKSGF